MQSSFRGEARRGWRRAAGLTPGDATIKRFRYADVSCEALDTLSADVRARPLHVAADVASLDR
jgi:hypothetical protein